MDTVTVSSKGQIAIPKAIREKLNLHDGAKLAIEIKAGKIVLSNPADWRGLKGIAKGLNLLDALEQERKEERLRDARR